MRVPKLLLTPVKIVFFGPKTAKFGPKYAFLGTYGSLGSVSAGQSYLNLQQNNVQVHANDVRLASVTPTLAPSGSNLLSQAFTGSLSLLLDLSMSLSGSLWFSVTPTLAPTGSHRHSLAYSGPLWLIIAL